MSREQAIAESASSKDAQERVWESFRRWGYLQANLDPLGDLAPAPMPELDVTGPEAEAARRVYCGSIGAEFMHIPDRERRLWVQERMESEVAEPDRARILDLLIRADIFEQVLQTRYLGTKRYSLEGESSLIPLLDSILSAAAEQGAEKAMLAMSHRGRLNVMVHIVGRAAVVPRRRRPGVGNPPGIQPQPSGSSRSGAHRAHTRQANAPRREGPAAGGADRDARRRRVRGPGNLRGDAEHGRR